MEKQMEMDKAQFAEQLKNLVELGKKKKNVLEYQETMISLKESP